MPGGLGVGVNTACIDGSNVGLGVSDTIGSCVGGANVGFNVSDTIGFCVGVSSLIKCSI